MYKNSKLYIILGFASILWLCTCVKPKAPTPMEVFDNPKYIQLLPKNFPEVLMPTDNISTVEGVKLGSMLFYDNILSINNTVSCASCHNAKTAFSDSPKILSSGVNGGKSKLNAMSLINVAYTLRFFWDGRSISLEEQSLHPIQDAAEMGESLDNVVKKLSDSELYALQFKKAFNGASPTADGIAKALAQYERTLISGNSKFDAYFPDNVQVLTAEEFRGKNIFYSETGDCFHCHGNILTQDVNINAKAFSNNGLNENINNTGLGAVNGKATDMGKFKAVTLRNIMLTAPYMHDGRFKTLEEVVEHYSSGIKFSETLDANFQKFNRVDEGGLNLSTTQKADLVAFLKTMTDTTISTNKAFLSPF